MQLTRVQTRQRIPESSQFSVLTLLNDVVVSLAGAENAVSSITKSGENIPVLIESVVEGRVIYWHIWMS